MMTVKFNTDILTLDLGGGGGGGVSESTDRQGCAILALKVVPKNLIFTKNPTQEFILQDFMLAISARKTVSLIIYQVKMASSLLQVAKIN